VNYTVYDLWWVQIVRGISAIAFGILVLAWPQATLGVIATLFASLFAVYGIMDIIQGVQGISRNFSSILRILLGALEIGVVIYLFQNAGSGLTLALMGLLMAVNFIVMAMVMVGSAFMTDMSTGYRWATAIAGALTLFVGITMARAPVVSLASVIYVLGIFGLFVGPVEIASGLVLKSQLKKAA
jgi:uncharacterized membrane protein HdeD (DUF308 family)